jgi:PAP2 superfamily protein
MTRPSFSRVPLRHSKLPHRQRDVLRQLLLFGGAYLLYQLVRAAVAGHAFSPGYTPFGNATRIIGLERALRIFVEPAVQAWTGRTPWLMDAADWSYLNAHYLVTAAALAFIYLRRNESFYFVRNVLLVAMAIALVGYGVFPTAPPRLMPEWGFTDSIQQFTGIVPEHGAAGSLVNLYAAVPSMHVCFAVIIGTAMFRLSRRRSIKLAWAAYPLWTSFVVIATGNHYLTDALLGVLTAAGAAVLAERVPARAKPAPVWPSGAAAADRPRALSASGS